MGPRALLDPLLTTRDYNRRGASPAVEAGLVPHPAETGAVQIEPDTGGQLPIAKCSGVSIFIRVGNLIICRCESDRYRRSFTDGF